jgi:hypothetical protein
MIGERWSIAVVLLGTKDEVLHQRPAEPRAALRHGAHGLHKGFGRLVLEHIPHCARQHDAAHVDIIIVRGENQHAGARASFANHRQCRDRRRAVHGQIQREDVRLQGRALPLRLVAVRCLARDGDVWLGLQRRAEAGSDQGVVIGDQYANQLAHRSPPLPPEPAP